ncbi:dihydrodipicolinate synthase [Syntrophobotulus glycolicus DSM 8271]|uniref:4-hydroxy-tetrahydrodipicolinate synthase n=1 Tax=Syntrophobotulus glycolicus (strain DSM 8271 / FlGlyR) TaxID=645991 RepID=F0STZ9_SYNGF|nr:4-hydroxy-tetrahydrodipicolinate synthase [Syntrophobotulus glycolicus]ADY56522.1 dihydrodipicolinate synthase [Syntrophobotulus glycolicus DSM 8271]
MFGNVLTAMVTPMNDKLEIDYKAAADLAIHLAQNGSDGIVVAGTTGETPTLSKEEKINLFREVKQAVGNSCKVIAGVGTYSTKESVELASRINHLNLDGVLTVVPYYSKPSQEGLYCHFKAIAEAADCPVMLYNIPGRTSLNMLPETVLRLSEVPNIVSIKEAAGSLEQVSELKSILPADFTIYAGDDILTLPMLSLGCRGIVSVAAHMVGTRIQKMIAAWQAGDTAKALKWHLSLYPVFKGMFVVTNPIPVKYILNETGFNVGGYRLPLVGPGTPEKTGLNNLIELIRNLPEEV